MPLKVRRPPFALMAAALVGGLLLGLLVFRSGAAPDLTSEALAEAEAVWQARGPASYVIELQMGGSLTDRRRVEVRGGTVVDMTVNGRAASPGSWEYWSVEGLFGFLREELRNQQVPPPALGVSDPRQIVLRAKFDAELGYPTYFLRHLLGRQQGTEWQVTDFRALSDGERAGSGAEGGPSRGRRGTSP